MFDIKVADVCFSYYRYLFSCLWNEGSIITQFDDDGSSEVKGQWHEMCSSQHIRIRIVMLVVYRSVASKIRYLFQTLEMIDRSISNKYSTVHDAYCLKCDTNVLHFELF